MVMIGNISTWMLIGVIGISIILIIIILFSRKNKRQFENVWEEIPVTHEKNYIEDPSYPSKLEQGYASAQTENFKVPVKPTRIDGEDYYYPPEE